MDIRTIAVVVDLETPASGTLTAAIDLAEQFEATLIGVGADEPTTVGVGLDGGVAALDFTEQNSKRLRHGSSPLDRSFSSSRATRQKPSGAHSWLRRNGR